MTITNLIIINGGAYNDIKKALRQWIDLYADNLQSNFTFELYKMERGHHLIKADDRLDNEMFYYLVNYLNYPEGIQYKIDIDGFTTAKKQEEIQNKKILVYISPEDTAGDNVFVVTSDNETFKFDFGGKLIKVNGNKRYRVPDIPQLSNAEIIRVHKKQTGNNKKEKKDNIKKRFRTISLIALFLLIVSPLTLLKDDHAFFKTTFLLGLGLSIWFLADYKLLQVDKYYLYSFLIALSFLGYGILIKRQFSDSVINLSVLGSLSPLSLLIVQKPLRLIYKIIFKREPVVDRPPPTFWDLIYALLLFFAIAALPFIVIDKLN